MNRLAAAAVLACVANMYAGIVVDHPGIAEPLGSYAADTRIVASKFTLSQTTTIQSARSYIVLVSSSASWNGTIQFLFYGSTPDNPFFPGSEITTGIVSTTTVGTSLVHPNDPLPLTMLTVEYAIPSVTLGPGTYWYGVHFVGPMSVVPPWLGTADNTTVIVSGTVSSTPSWSLNSGEMAYQLSTDAVPEAASLGMLAAGAAVLMKRRHFCRSF